MELLWMLYSERCGMTDTFNLELTALTTSELPITTIPVSVTVGRIGEHIIADPSGEEWDCLDARITITTNSDGNICALQKGGTDGFTAEDLIKCGGIAISSGSRIREIIKRVKE
jgi:exosome complex component RRP42